MRFLLLLIVLFINSCTYNTEKPAKAVITESEVVSISNLIERTHLQYISDYDGESPREVSLWQTRPLSDRLPALLGPDYALFLETIASAKIITVEGDSVSIISENDSDRVPNATFQADIEHNSIHVRLFTNGKFKEFSEEKMKHFRRNGIAKLVKN